MRGRPPAGRAAATVAALVAALVSCGGGDDGTPDGTAEREGTAESSPFLVGAVPEGYGPIVAGRGAMTPDWGSDSFGTQEPFTVLAPPGGDATGDGAVVVSATGLDGDLSEPDVADGQRLDVRGDGVALRVRGVGAVDGGTLDEVLARADLNPDGDRLPPTVADPPDGLEVVGSVDADVHLAVQPPRPEPTDSLPGPESAHVAGWRHADRTSLVVMTLPGRAADLDALPRLVDGAYTGTLAPTRPATVGDRPALVVEAPDVGVSGTRALVTRTAWGDLLVVASSGPVSPAAEELGPDAADLAPAATVAPAGAGPLDDAALAAVAASVTRADAAAWDALRVEAVGGPALLPDPGATEVTRGTVGDVTWVLQAVPGPSGVPLVDPCLRVSTGDRVCAQGNAGPIHSDPAMAATQAFAVPGSDPGDRGDASAALPGFALVGAPGDVPTVRVTTNDATATAATAPVPGTELRAAVVFVEGTATPDCAGDLATPRRDRMSVQLLDAAGTATACVEPSGDLTPL
jgi:hypothetical protein